MHPLQPDSPLINIAPDCAGLTDDQRGVSRPMPYPGGNCDPGSYEFDTSNPPTAALLEPSPSPDSLPCDLFDRLQYTVVLSNLSPETGELTLYIMLADGEGLEFWNGHGGAAYFALLGDAEADGYQEAGFPGRIYFQFTLPGSAAGNVLDFQLFRDDCAQSLATIPGVSIPELETPDKICKIGLDERRCKKAGGTWVDGGAVGASYCDCK